MIVITGSAGFIGSVMAGKLNREGYYDLVLVDDFGKTGKESNTEGKRFTEKVSRDSFFSWLDVNHRFVQAIVHLGARTDTTEFDWAIFEKLNLGYSKQMWQACVNYGLPLIYASSAATYGSGELGYNDDHGIVDQLKPLNPYGKSKNDFDSWALKQPEAPYFWAGLKFFNVYGPNEYHKGRMASVVFHAFRQIREKGELNLFRSHRPDFTDGGQMRDFVYVEDVVEVIFFLLQLRKYSGLYNLGTGRAEPFIDLARACFTAMSAPEQIRFIDTPEDIRDKYQYFTEANMSKLRSIGYDKPFRDLQQGVSQYVGEYLIPGKYY